MADHVAACILCSWTGESEDFMNAVEELVVHSLEEHPKEAPDMPIVKSYMQWRHRQHAKGNGGFAMKND